MRDWEILLIAIGGLSVLWIVLGWVTPKLRPWGRLVAQYPAHDWTPTVFKARFVSMSCLWFSYGNCLTIEFADDTMTVWMGALCLPFHAPFTLPKSAIHAIRRGRSVFIP